MTTDVLPADQDRWRIAWRSRVTGVRSCGQGVFRSEAEAQTKCDEANRQWPELDHWPESLRIPPEQP